MAGVSAAFPYKRFADADIRTICAKSNLFYTYTPGSAKSEARVAVTAPCRMALADSGAYYFIHKFRAQRVSEQALAKSDPDGYVDGYIRWMQRLWNHVDYFFEFDLQELLPYEKIKAWRKRFRDAGVDSKLVLVHHRNNTLTEFDEILDTSASRYVAISKMNKATDYAQYIRRAFDRGVLVHGLGMTRTEITQNHPFYSVDSVTWINLRRFGSVSVCSEDSAMTITTLSRRQKARPAMRTVCRRVREASKAGYNAAVIVDRHAVPKEYYTAVRDEGLRIAMAQTLEYERRTTALWQARGIDWTPIEQRVLPAAVLGRTDSL